MEKRVTAMLMVSLENQGQWDSIKLGVGSTPAFDHLLCKFSEPQFLPW